VLFRPSAPSALILSLEAKNRLIERLGVDLLITQKFDRDFANLEAEDFLPHLTQYLPTVRSLYVGENWEFGHGRRGNLQFLLTQTQARGISVQGAERVMYGGQPVSSTRIRQALQEGNVGDANAMLGYRYFSDGVVTPGKQLGRTLGFPTLNVAWEPPLRPKYGVYAVYVSRPESAERYPAVANYGLRPTVENSNQPRVEAHLLGECPFGSGDLIRIEWEEFLRPEQKFAGIDELRMQIGRDRERAKTYFNKIGAGNYQPG
jgi:riboflavin kinase/FMN adenylyltransferase